MNDQATQTSSSRILRVLNCLDVLPPALKWLLVVVVCFPAPNFILMLMTGVGMEQGWQSGDWATCGDAALVRYFWASWLIFLPVIPAVKLEKLRWPVMALLIVWTFANFLLPHWFVHVAEWSCGPRPWL